tara:strand:+ start:423 stop:1052 length:630 start_codon:yes stop_codon:yes gene_type:complete
MRLLCPKCDAEYEVADSIIPNAGRDVQCSSCDTIWFVEIKPAPLKSSGIDPEVISILQQEAQRELAARNVETSNNSRPSAIANPAETKEPSARIQTTLNAKNPPSRRNHMPPIEDMDTELTETPPMAEITLTSGPEDDVPPLNNRQRGILVAVTLLGALAALYVFAPKITEAFPAYTDWVNFYILWVDDIRQWLQSSVSRILEYRQSFG